ncbi:MAG: hypothetical protein UHM85_01655 [Acutalibacteraceae bacterium]|nr:hypothetical protein [Acutalibacteraceae bacterium]
MKAGKIKKLSMKSLSVLLAVVMIMSSMSVCFGTVTYAAGGSVSDSNWNSFIDLLKNDTVKNASFTSTTANNYTVTDPDGKIIAAVEMYFDIFDTLADKEPSNSSAGNRTINEVNTTIKNTLSNKMSGDYSTYNIDSFISKLISGANVISSKGTKKEVKNSNSAPGTNLNPVSDVKLNVTLGGELTKYATIDELPDEVATTKTFTVKHTNSRYDTSSRTQNTTDSCGNVTGTDTYYGFEYYYSISSVTEAEGAKQSTKVLKDTAKTLSDNSAYLNANLDQMVQFIIDDASAVATAQSAVNTAKSNATAFSQAAWNQYFKATYDSKILALESNITLATEIVALGKVAYPLTALKNAGYDSILTNEAALRSLYSQLTEGLATFDKATQSAKDYISGHAYQGVEFNRADIQAFADEVLVEIQLIELRRLKDTIDTTTPDYYTYNDDNVTGQNATVSGAALSTAKGTVDGYISSINSYPAVLVAEAELTGYTDWLAALSTELNRLIKISGYNDQFSAQYAKYVAEVYSATDTGADSATLLAALKGNADEGIESYDAWYSGLKSLISTIETQLGAELANKIMTTLDDAMKARMDAVYTTLHSRVDAQLDNATELYNVVKALNGKINILTTSNYAKYKKAFESFEKDVYDFLIASANFSMPKATIDKYNALGKDFKVYTDFIATGGFSSYKQILGEYADRELLTNDLLRDEEYVVDKAKVENVIASLDKLITSDEIGGLLGGLLGLEEGESFDIGTMLEELVVDMLFSDSFINTAIEKLYPAVLGALIAVWEKDVPNVGVESGQDIAGMLQKDLYAIVNDMGFALYPDQYAAALRNIDSSRYADNISKLQTGTRTYTVEKVTELNGDGKTIVKEVTVTSYPWDVAGSAFLNEDGSLNLTWGVDEYKETEGVTTEQIKEFFYARFDDAFTPLAPLFFALIGNTSWTGTSSKAAKYLIAEVDLKIEASGNDGYANMMVPIYEALGAVVEGTEGATFTYKAPSTVKGYATQSDRVGLMLSAILEPIFGLLNEIGKAPLSTIISILPNLCYSLLMQMVNPLLNQLKTTITLKGDAGFYNYIVNGCDQIDINLDNLYSTDLAIGDILGDINSLIDLSNGINSLLGLLGLPLPEIEQGKIAQMGELTTISTSRTAYIYTGFEGTGEARHIEADKGAVGNYLLQYILGILEDEEAFKGLLGMIMTVKDENGQPVKDSSGKTIPDTAKIEETIASFNEMGLFKYGKNNAIAAIVELFNADTLPYAEYNWYVDEMFDGTVQGLTPAMVQYLSYDNDLTREKAAYIVDHLDELISSIIDMVNGNPEGTYSIAAKLDELIGGLFTNENITVIAKALAGFDINSLLAGEGDANAPETVAEGDEPEAGEGEAEEDAAAIDVNALIKDLLGIDLSVFAQYKDIADDYDWGVTDGATFAKALADLLAPLNPLLNFILKGDDIKVITDENGANAAITLKGSNAYDTALVPLLEALGCETKVLAEDDNVIEVVLLAIVNKLETIIGEDADAVEGIANLLPGVLYFLQSNALSSVVENLLHPVYQLIDTIRPIYELDIFGLIGGLLPEDFPITLDKATLSNLDLNFVIKLVKDLLGLDFTDLGVVIADVCKVAVQDYKSSSSLIGEDGKKGAYTKLFDATDIVAVILNFAFDWFTVPENVDAMANVIGGDNAATVEKTKKYIDAIYTIIEGVEIQYDDINWAYNFPEGFDEAIFSSGISIQPTIESLKYPTDWTEDTAKYLDENLDDLINAALKLAGVEGTLSDMLKSEINFLTGANLNAIVTMLNDLLGKLNKEIVDNAGVLIGADLEALRNYKADEEKTYTTVEFAKELAKILNVIPEVVNLVFFGDNFEIFNYANGESVGTITGANGYSKGLAPILEALGCKNLPAADSKDVEAVLVSIANRFDEILADPINEVLNVLPNIIYFINANGISVSLKNMVASVTGFMALLKESFGVDVDLIAIINDALNGLLPAESNATIDVLDLDLETVFTLVQEILGLDLTMASDILVDLCVGKIEAYKSISGDYAFRMVYNDDYARYDMITILVTIALMVVSNEQNAKALDEMLGTELLSALKTVFASVEINYEAIDWDYCWDENGEATGDTIPVIESAITYPNDFTEEDAKYLAENLPALVDAVVKLVSENESLAQLLKENVNIFNAKTLEDLVGLIADLLGDVDSVLLGLGMILDVDLNGLLAHEIDADIDTVEEFAAELAEILSKYAPGVIEWLLLGRDFTFFVDETKMAEGVPYDKDKAIITINGAQGYAEGLALVLEALGCENLPKVYEAEKLDTTAVIEGVLTSLANRINEIFANPVEEALDLLPNLLYFLNANGVAAAVNNLAGAFSALATKLQAFGLDISLGSLVNIKKLMGLENTNAAISLDNLTVEALLEAVSLMTGLDLTTLDKVLTGFALGEVKEYDSVSKEAAYKMVYHTDFENYDMITVLVTAALLVVFETEGNAEKLNEMIGTDIITAIEDVFAASEISYTAPNWSYPLAANGTVDAMKYSITYPNNWTEETAKYVTAALPQIGDMIAGMIDSNYTSLAALLQDKVNVFNADTLNSLVALIADLLGGIDDELLKAAGVLLNVDVVGLKAYKAPEINSTEAFAAELANVLTTYAGGVVEWLLLGKDYKFFVKDVTKDGIPVDFIIINGAHGYAEGLALLLEALGCTDLPDAYAEGATTKSVVEGTLLSLAKRIDTILANPVVEVLGILPNLLYFLNTNGVAAVVDNLTAALTALLDKLAVFGIKLDLNELVNLQKLMGIEGKGANIDLDNLTIADLLEAVSLMTGLDLTLIEDVLVGFALGEVKTYDSVSKECGDAKRMLYADEFDTYDMVTVLANLVLLTIADEDNAEFVKNLTGEEIYGVIVTLFNVESLPVQEFDWLFTEYADTDHVFSAILSSELYADHQYGPLYTEEMAQYIADNFGKFVDNIIYLLGLNINGTTVDNLTDLINGLINGSVYNSANVVAIRDALAGVLDGIVNLKAGNAVVGGLIAEVLKTAGIADLAAVAEVEVPEFTEDRAKFVESLCDVLEPLYGVLRWVLSNEDISFFVDLDKTDAITLPGAEGYAYGIIPLLEVLECENILTPAEYYAAVEADGDVLLTSILNPLLDRVDVIIENPAEEILAILPNLIYFINSNGIDTVVKNTLNAVYTLLNVIEPIAKIDLYEIIGIDLSTLTFEKLFSMLLDMIYDATGYRFTFMDVSAVAELSVGTLVSYESKNGKTAYKMIYNSNTAKSEMVTVVMRLLVTFIMHENNQEMLLGLLRDKLGMTADAEKYVRGILDYLKKNSTVTALGMDLALATFYYIFYGVDIGVDHTANGVKDLNAEWTKLLNDMRNSKNEGEALAGEIIAGILDLEIFDDVIDPEEGVAPNGFIAFFQKIIDWFNKIIEWFKNLFN